MPFDLKAINTDSGSEFLNTPVFTMFQEKQKKFTRSRPYKKMTAVIWNKKTLLTQGSFQNDLHLLLLTFRFLVTFYFESIREMSHRKRVNYQPR